MFSGRIIWSANKQLRRKLRLITGNTSIPRKKSCLGFQRCKWVCLELSLPIASQHLSVSILFLSRQSFCVTVSELRYPKPNGTEAGKYLTWGSSPRHQLDASHTCSFARSLARSRRRPIFHSIFLCQAFIEKVRPI